MKYLYGITILVLSFGAALLFTQTVEAVEAAKAAAAAKDALNMNMNINIGNLSEPKQVAGTIKILLIMTSFTLLPGLLMVMTSFTRIIIVLSFARKALSFQQMPPN